MKSFLSVTVLLALAGLSFAVDPGYKEKVLTAFTQCVAENNLDIQKIIEFMKTNKLPETKEQKCAAGCFFNKMGFVKDLTIDWETIKAANPKKYDTPELVEKANQVVDTCSKVVTEKAQDVCELMDPTLKCLKEEADKVNLPKPDIKFT